MVPSRSSRRSSSVTSTVLNWLGISVSDGVADWLSLSPTVLIVYGIKCQKSTFFLFFFLEKSHLTCLVQLDDREQYSDDGAADHG